MLAEYGKDKYEPLETFSAPCSLSSGRLDDASLRTFFYEAMAMVNSRPLTVDNLHDRKSL